MLRASNGWATSSQCVIWAAKKPSACATVRGSTGFNAAASTRNKFKPCVHTACSCASAPSCLANTHGLNSSMYLLASSASAIVNRNALAASLRSYASRTPARASTKRVYCAVSGRLAASWPLKRFSIKPAQRLAKFTNLPTTSLFTRATKSARFKSTSSTPPEVLPAK